MRGITAEDAAPGDTRRMTPQLPPMAPLPTQAPARELADSDAVIVALGLWIAVLAAYVGESTA